MSPRIYRTPHITPEMLELAQHQVEQQEEIDRQAALIVLLNKDASDLRADVLARTVRIHALEIEMRKNNKDVTLAVAAISDLLTDLLPRRDERVTAQLETLFNRMQSAEEALDCLESCNNRDAQP